MSVSEMKAQLDNPKLITKGLAEAKRPIIVLGHGVKLSGTQVKALHYAELFQIPIVTTKLGFDLITEYNPLLAGRIGVNGQRCGNIAVQNADFILVLGARLSQPTTGYNFKAFGRNAKIAIVDADPHVLNENFKKFKPEYIILSDLNMFFDRVKDLVFPICARERKSWLKKIQDWRGSLKFAPLKEYDPYVHHEDGFINSYSFYHSLSQAMAPGDIMVTDQGAAFYGYNVTFQVKKDQHIFTNGGFSPMGYGLPAAIGAHFGRNGSRKNLVCVHGDGGLMLNLQELQTVKFHKIPLKLFVFNNQGYLSIKHTQDLYFNGHRVGCDKKSGLTLPRLDWVSMAFDMQYDCFDNEGDLIKAFPRIFAAPGPMLIEIKMNPEQKFWPKTVSSKRPDGTMVSPPLEDMTPKIDIKREMYIKDWNYE